MIFIKTTRLLLGISQKRLANEAQITTRALNRIENKAVRANRVTLSALDDALQRIVGERIEMVGGMSAGTKEEVRS